MPDGFTPPKEKQFALPALFEVSDDKTLALVSVAGQPVDDAAEEAAESPDQEQAEQTPSSQSFQQAVEQGMAKQ